MKTGTVLLLTAALAAMAVRPVSAAPCRDPLLAGSITRQPLAGSENPLLMTALQNASGGKTLAVSGTKSVPKAFLLSLLLPGAGQFYAQAPGRGRLFAGTEVGILVGYFGFRWYGDWKKEDYQLYAAAHAGVDPRGKSDRYFEDVSLYTSMEEYNNQQLHDFREDAVLYSGADFWEWDNDRSQREFDSLYRASSNAKDNAIIMTGLGLLNHLLSAVDAARTARAYNRQHASTAQPVRLTFDVRAVSGSSVVVVGLEKTF
jgi:hypothetical protein